MLATGEGGIPLVTQGAIACIMDVLEQDALYNLTGGEPSASS